MTIADINKALQAQLPTGVLTLSPALFDNDPGLTPLLQMYFFEDQGSIKIKVDAQGYNFNPINGIINFSGLGQSGPFQGFPIPRVSIKILNNAPQCAIKCTPPDDTTLFDIFPALDAEILQELPLKDIAFYWASYDNTKDNTLQGFYIDAQLDFKAPPLNLIQFLFPSQDGPMLWGQIKMQGTASPAAVQFVPDMILMVDATDDEIKFGPFTLEGPQFQITSSPYFNTTDLQWGTDSQIQVTVPFAFKDTWITLMLNMSDSSDTIIFDAQIDAPLASALADISGMVTTELSIPSFNIQNPGGLELEDLVINYNTAQKQIALISVSVGMAQDEKWPLWGDVFLEDIKVTFLLSPKTEGSGYNLDGQIFGVVSDWLALSADFSTDGHYNFTGRLNDPSTPFTIQQLYTFFTNTPAPDDLPKLEITTFYFSLDRTPDGNGGSKYTFEGDVVIDGEWDLLTTPINISLEGLNFHLKKEGGVDDDLNFKAGGILGIADYSMALEAEYDSLSKWVFTGDLSLEDENQRIPDMNQRIDTGYPNKPNKPANIPPFLADWYVLNLHTQYATLKKDMQFNMAVKNSSYPWLELDFGITLLHSDTAYDKTLNGAIKIDTKIENRPLKAEFDLIFSESDSNAPQPVKTYKAQGYYVTQEQSAPSLSDFLLYLAQNNPLNSNLPTELNFDVALDGFAIEVQKVGEGNTVVELAGDFELTFGRSSTWELYFAYTTDVSFTQNGAASLLQDSGTDPTTFVAGVALGGLIDLSKLPLVGKIPGVDLLKIDKLGFYYTNANFPTADAKLQFKIPALGNDSGQLGPNPTEAYLTHSGFTLMAVLGNQQANNPLNSTGTLPLPVDTGTPASGQSGFTRQPAAPKDPIKWLEINKTLGPVSLEKIGIAYSKAPNPDIQLGTIGFYLDGSFKISTFEMALDRLGLSFNIPKPNTQGASFDPMRDIGFHLGGLFVNYKAPDFQIAGGFVSLPDTSGVNFIGEFTVLAGVFGLQAYGGFSNDTGSPSLFIFLHVNAPIGGPPFFFINGLAGGFGVNRGFVLPTFDQLTNYPFLPSSSTIPTADSLTGDAASQLKTMSTALSNLAQYVPVKEGQYWFAVGLDVSSFEMIQVSAVLSVAFGVKFQVGLVGSASMTLPVQEPEPIAYLQIDFEVDFSPADGLLAAFGKITPASYVFANFVHLSGGFAFYTWFDGLHEGDFVVTLGGYHPQYQKPDYYPTVQRLQLGFVMGNLVVQGQSYFALTGNAIMAGIAMQASWSLGPISAWFDAGVDFLIGWKPFHYEAEAYIHIGIALTIDFLFVHIRISVSVGVMLEIWGPAFGGKATIDLDIVSFTIHFGEQAVAPPAVDWGQFSAFLPNINGKSAGNPVAALASATTSNPPLVSITVTKGLLKTYQPGEDPSGLDWLIDANDFAIHTQTIAPTTQAGFNNIVVDGQTAYLNPADLAAGVHAKLDAGQQAPFFAYAPVNNNPDWYTLSFGAAPMGLTDIQALHVVNINVLDDSGHLGAPVKDLIAILQTSSVQTALWGNKGAATTSLNGKDSIVSGVMNGFTLVPMMWFPARTAFIPYYYLVFDTNDLFLEQDVLPTFNTAPVNDPVGTYANMYSGEAFSNTTSARKDILSLLQAEGFVHLGLQNDGALNTDEYLDESILAYFS